MNISLTDKNCYLITLLISICAGWAAIITAGIIGDNYTHMVAFPFLLLLTLLTLMDLRYPLILIILFRPLLDPLLEMTKVEIFGQNMGVGALLNGLIILLTGLLLLKERTCLDKVTGCYNWLVFLSLCIISLFVSVDPGRGFRLALNYLSYFCLFLLPFILVKKGAELVFWLRLLLASGFLVIISGTVDFIRGGSFFPESQTIRIRGAFLHPNILAFYLILLIVICIFVFEERIQLIPKFQGYLLSLIIISSGFLILETKTRNAWIALWILLITYALLRHRRFLVPLLIMPFVALFIPSFNDRILEVLSPSHTLSNRLDSFAWRVSLWKSALPLVWHSPFIGHGLESFRPLSPGFSKLLAKEGGHAHNVFLELAFEIGIPGLIAYLSIHVVILYKFINKFTSAIRYLIVSLIVSYCVTSFADNMLRYLPYNWHYWFFVGLTCIYLRDDHGQIQYHNTSV